MEERTDIKEQPKEEKSTEAMLPLASIRRILKERGINKISKSGLEEIRMIVQDIIKDMANNIIIYTKHAKRKISTKEDVLLSIR